MENKKLKLNLHPALLAAQLVEQGEYKTEQIGIHSAAGVPGPALREILEVRADKKKDALTIVVHSKREARIELERELPKEHPLLALAVVFEHEATLFKIALALRERKHLLGLSPLQSVFFVESRQWREEEQQRKLAFFKPYQSIIKGDLVLMAKCLSAALEEQVKVVADKPLNKHLEGSKVGKCILDAEFLAGGTTTSLAPCVHLTIGPISAGTAAEYVKGGRQQVFLEKALLPMMLPEGWEWSIEITVSPEDHTLRIAKSGRPVCIGINSLIA